jgi:hypothetical protein
MYMYDDVWMWIVFHSVVFVFSVHDSFSPAAAPAAVPAAVVAAAPAAAVVAAAVVAAAAAAVVVVVAAAAVAAAAPPAPAVTPASTPLLRLFYTSTSLLHPFIPPAPHSAASGPASEATQRPAYTSAGWESLRCRGKGSNTGAAGAAPHNIYIYNNITLQIYTCNNKTLHIP